MITVAFFDTKNYDKTEFIRFGEQRGIEYKFFETKLSEDTVTLASGCDCVCIFVNDVCNKAVIDRLYQMGIKAIALRCAGYNNVDINRSKQSVLSILFLSF